MEAHTLHEKVLQINKRLDINVETLDNRQDTPLQWWYGNCCLRRKGETEYNYGFFSSFFRQCEDVNPDKSSNYYDACTWAIIDNQNERYLSDSLLDCDAIRQIQNRIASVEKSHFVDSLCEMINNNRLPKPDRLLTEKALYGESPFSISMDYCKLNREEKESGFEYLFENYGEDGTKASLRFLTNSRSPCLQGENGIVNHMFYYFFPSVKVEGSITVEGEEIEVEGLGWYDREFGGANNDVGRNALDNWMWYSLHLCDFGQLSVFCVNPEAGDSGPTYSGSVISNNEKTDVELVKVTFQKHWTSLVTFLTYPVECTMEIPSLNMICNVNVTFMPQEFNTCLVTGYGFYEGCVSGTAIIDEDKYEVHGFVEIKTATQAQDSSSLMKRVSSVVTKNLQELYPLEADGQWLTNNVFGSPSYGLGIQSKIICESLFKPVRSIIDRGGKSWRSLILVSCCNALSPRYFDCSRYIAMAELLHVGSLIIDDIEDHSSTRRGGPSCHVEYGLSCAINAGTACYFMAPYLARLRDLEPLKANRIYELYFDVLRMGHIGQALDLYGLDHLMDEVVRTGNTESLIESLRAVHTHKTGGAAGNICLMAGVLCDADDATCEAIRSFGSALGLAFQIVDDALNIKGFSGDLKELAEDIRDGKVTYPIALSMKKLPLELRERLWRTLRAKPKSKQDIDTVIHLVEEANSIADSLCEARALVDSAWNEVDPFLTDSISKCMMHAFCKYLTERAT